MALFNDTETYSISAQNTGSNPICISKGGNYNVSIDGSFAATVTLQRTFDNVSDQTVSPTWRDVKNYTAPIEDVCIEASAGTWVRLFCKTSNFTGGLINIRISYHGVGQAFPLASTTYVPVLDYYFSQYSGLNPAITFSRAGTATYFDSSGTLKLAPWNTARFTYDPVSHAAQGLMVEAQGTNLLTYSSGIGGTGWNNTAPAATINANAAVAPDGNSTATQISYTGAVNVGTYQAITVSNSTTYTQSVYLKYVSGATSLIIGNTANPVTATIVVNVQTGAITSTAASITSSSSTAVGNGWYRFSWTYTTTGTTNYFTIYTNSTSATTWLAWGAQLETGSLATSYIPTNSTNLLTYSEQFDNAAWTKTRSVTVANTASSPDGNSTADRLRCDSSVTTDHYAIQITSGTSAGSIYTCSIYAKCAELTRVMVSICDSTDYVTSRVNGIFNLTAVTASNSGGGSSMASSITDVGGGWYRCVTTGIAKPSSSGAVAIIITLLNSSGSATFTGDGSSGLYLWGAQLEQNTVPSTYIATTSSAITTAPTMTRSADSVQTAISNGSYDVLVQDVNGGGFNLGTVASGGTGLTISPRANQNSIKRWRVSNANFLTSQQQTNMNGAA